MFFILSKTLDLLVDPLWWSLVASVAGVALLVRGKRRRLGVALACAGPGILAIACTPAVSHRLWRSLEAGAVDTSRADVTYDAVVLLGGVVEPRGAEPSQPAWGDSVERLTITWDLLRTGRARVAVVSGGALTDAPELPTEADFLAAQLEAWGIEPERIVREDRARNTRENATFTAPLLEARGLRRVLLVTSAFHMPRAVGCFRAVGVDADALPVDFRARHPAREPHLLPRGEHLDESALALREWLGRAVYRLVGYTSDTPKTSG